MLCFKVTNKLKIDMFYNSVVIIFWRDIEQQMSDKRLIFLIKIWFYNRQQICLLFKKM